MKTGQRNATENQQRKVRTKNDAVVVTQLADGYFRYEGAQFESSHQQNLSSTHLFKGGWIADVVSHSTLNIGMLHSDCR